MARKYFTSSFYTDPYVIKLTRDQMYFYQYLLLCERNNLSGVYENPVEVMSFESKFTIDEVRTFLSKFESDKKLLFIDDYVILFNFLKNQSYNRNIMIAILNSFLDLPLNILEMVFKIESITKCFKIKDKEMQSLYNQILSKINKSGMITESLGNDNGMITESLGNAVLDENNDKNFSKNEKESFDSDNALNQIKSNQTKENQIKSNHQKDCETSFADDDFLRSDFQNENGSVASSADLKVGVGRVSDFKTLQPMTKRNPAELIRSGGILEKDEYCQISKKDIPEIMDIYAKKFPEIREILSYGISKVKLFDLMKSFPLAELTAMMWKAEESAKSNPAGYFIKLCEETEPDDFDYNEHLPDLRKIVFKMFEKHGYNKALFKNVEAS